MADTTLVIVYPTGVNLYTQIVAPDNTVWNGLNYVALSVASWATFATSTLETPASSGVYVCQFPVSSPAGNYKWRTYLRAGGSPVSSDVCVGTGSGFWDGTTFGSVNSITDKAGFALSSTGIDSIVIEAAAGSQPNINARQGIALVFNAACYGLLNGVGSPSPVQILNPAGTVVRATVTTDSENNRTNVEFNNLP